MHRMLREGRWDNEQVVEEAYFSTRDRAAEEKNQKHAAEDTWPLLHTDDGMATLINETVSTPGGIEAIAILLAALMRAPTDCQSVAVDDLRKEFVSRADHYLDTPSMLVAQAD